MHKTGCAVLLSSVLVADPTALDMFSRVLRLGLFGFRDEESAAFIVKRNDQLQCIIWPPTNEFHRASYRQALPEGVVAIVHTHPMSSPRPSSVDRETAQRLGIPIYAINLANIYQVDALGRVIAHVRNRQWARDRQLMCRGIEPPAAKSGAPQSLHDMRILLHHLPHEP